MKKKINFTKYILWFFRITFIISLVPVIIFCGIIFPQIFLMLINSSIVMDKPVFTLIISFYIILPFYICGLVQAFKLMSQLEKIPLDFEMIMNKIKKIAIISGVVTIILILDLIPLYLFANREDSPKTLLLGIFITGCCIVFTSSLILLREVSFKFFKKQV